MDRDEALALLGGGADGVKEWNRRRGEGEEIPALDDAKLVLAHLDDADLSGVSFHLADLSGAYFRRAKLGGAKLGGADLSGAHLDDADLSGAHLAFSKFISADLIRANLSGACLDSADLSGAHLDDADLSGAQLLDAKLCYADLRGANLKGAKLWRTQFTNLDLTKVKSLEANHLGPSSVGTDTLRRSNGNIPNDFLRGCGLSLWEIETARLYNPDLSAHEVNELVSADLFSKRTDGPLYFRRVFISYSHLEKRIADKLCQRLRGAGAPVWMDRHDAVAGDLNEQILHEIRQGAIVLLILSENSVNSDWVEHEVKFARMIEKKEGRKVICPISVDDSWKQMMSNPHWGHLSDKNILDFSAWKTKAFDKQFDKLLKGMKINYEVRE